MRLACILVLLLATASCGGDAPPALVHGDPERGRQLLRQFSCGACHAIPRVYLAGVLPNTPQNLAAFIREPQKADPRTAMPAMGVTEEQARDMTTYLYTLR